VLKEESLEGLENIVNKRLSAINRLLAIQNASPAPFQGPAEKKEETDDLKTNRALLFDAGKVFYRGLPPVDLKQTNSILSFQDWANTHGKKISDSSFMEYLASNLNEVTKYLNEKNSLQYTKFSNLTNNYITNKKLKDCFSKLKNAIVEFKKFHKEENYIHQDEKLKNDKLFVQNLANIFEISPKTLDKIFPPEIALPPDPKIALTNEREEIQRILAELNTQNFKSYTPRIEILDGTSTNPIMIFTSP
jgi:hypothetical protein